eukprot:TRINITY_DN8350_c3_g1_i1.p1 TRINITY_DN8350_c3_g1~~TRINITY_DN8350_c3_g1_i1.p1  ORF type:complete len:467 (+),score=75.40 TRINITY_DN8350_c3_g1_i1:65-1402(+)
MQRAAATASGRRVVVVGGGHVGVCTAWYLRQRGCDVSVVERLDTCGAETSKLNGGLLCPSLTQPWPCWATLRVAARSLLPGGAEGVCLHPSALLSPLCLLWILFFVRNCAGSRLKRNFELSYALSELTRKCLSELPVSAAEYRRTAVGTLSLFSSDAACKRTLAAAAAAAAHAAAAPPKQVTSEQLISIEPLLSRLPKKPAAAALGPDDSSGDIFAFTSALQRRCAEAGVEFRTGFDVRRVIVNGGRVSGVDLGGAEMSCTDVVVAAGNGAESIASAHGDRLLSLPVKGYALELPTDPCMPQLRHNVVDDTAKVYASPLATGAATRVRISGGVEIGGAHGEMDYKRASAIARAARKFFPAGYLRGGEEEPNGDAIWSTCSRPQTPDDLPVVGPSRRVAGLWYNAGHGHLGWTRGAGAALLLACQMVDETPPMQVEAFSPARFSVV